MTAYHHLSPSGFGPANGWIGARFCRWASARRAAAKNQSDRRKADEKKKEPIAARKLYRKFLFYKNFLTPRRPLIVTEGKTDVVYLKYTIRYLPGFHPRLGQMEAGKFINALRFLNYTDTVRDVLQIGGGLASSLVVEIRR